MYSDKPSFATTTVAFDPASGTIHTLPFDFRLEETTADFLNFTFRNVDATSQDDEGVNRIETTSITLSLKSGNINYRDGGVVTFDDSTISEITVACQLELRVGLARNVTQEFQASSSRLDQHALEAQLDDQTAQLAKVSDDLEEAVTSIDPIVIPSIPARKGKILSFDDEGNVDVTMDKVELAGQHEDVERWHEDVNGWQQEVEANLALTNADVALTKADVVATGFDVDATNADVVLTNADVVSTNADVVTTNADVDATNADVVTTNADVVLTNADAVQTAFDRIATGEDATQTALDVIATNADVVLTNADVVLTNADVVTTETARDVVLASMPPVVQKKNLISYAIANPTVSNFIVQGDPSYNNDVWVYLNRDINKWFINLNGNYIPYSPVYIPFNEATTDHYGDDTIASTYSCATERSVVDYQGEIIITPPSDEINIPPMKGARYETVAQFDGASYLDCGNDPSLHVTNDWEFGCTFESDFLNTVCGIVSKGTGTEFSIDLRMATNTIMQMILSNTGTTVEYHSMVYTPKKGDIFKYTFINGLGTAFVNGLSVSNRTFAFSSVFNAVSYPLNLGVVHSSGGQYVGAFSDVYFKKTGTTVLDLPLRNGDLTDNSAYNQPITNNGDRGVYFRAISVHDTLVDGTPIDGIVYDPDGEATNYIKESFDFGNFSEVRISKSLSELSDLGMPVYRMTEDNTSPTHEITRIYNTSESIGTGIKCASVIVKAEERKTLQLILTDDFDSSNGGKSNTVAKFYTSDETYEIEVDDYGTAHAGIKLLGNGYYCCWLTTERLVDVNSRFVFTIRLCNASDSPIYTGDGVSGMLMSSPQFETGYAPSAYIPTWGTAETRLAGSLVTTEIFQASKFGTLISQVSLLDGEDHTIFSTDANLFVTTSNNIITVTDTTGGGSIVTGAILTTGDYHIAVVINDTLITLYVNGVETGTSVRTSDAVSWGISHIGNASDGTGQVGTMTNLIIDTDRALTLLEIQEMYLWSTPYNPLQTVGGTPLYTD